MREILFRGKRADNGEWVYGYYLEDIGSCIKEKLSAISTQTYLVLPETVGQYTGLTDKYNRKIFEGDIVFFDGKYGKIVFNAHHGEYELDTDREDFPICFHEEFEVRGNVHDDPRLL